ncbi:MAG: hypothetical protein JWM14_2131 [Chitinophagaceae bacterium]|nr:hypothetical protein [Chitinophagaceae bacterium]
MNERQTTWISCLVTLVYFILSYTGILHHELWLDESHHYLLARNSHSLGELFYNARYEGHPLTWNLLLFVLTTFTHNPFYMQLLHIVISTAAVFLFLRYAPFVYYIRVMIVFGYFFFYEYNIISRSYSISLLMLVISCVLISRNPRNYIAIAISLTLLANTHLFSFVVAVALLLVVLIDLYRKQEFSLHKKSISWAALILTIGLVWLLLQVIVPPGHFLKMYDTDSYYSFKRIGKMFSIVMKGLYHIPNVFILHFWNTNLLVSASKKWSTIPVFLALFIPLIYFIKKPISLFFFYFATAGIMLLVYLSPLIVAARHWGFVFLIFIVACWLEQTIDQGVFTYRSKWYTALTTFSQRFRPWILYSILGLQLCASAFAFTMDLNHPFSNAKTVAAYLKTHHDEKEIIALAHHSSGPPLSLYLDKPLFYPENNSFQTFCLWNTWPYDLSDEEILNRIQQLLITSHHTHALLVINHQLYNKESDRVLHQPVKALPAHMTLLKVFSGAIVKSENYYLYNVTLQQETVPNHLTP